VSADILPQVTK